MTSGICLYYTNYIYDKLYGEQYLYFKKLLMLNFPPLGILIADNEIGNKQVRMCTIIYNYTSIFN